MNIQRFYAPTAREALSKARLAFGENTLILSNRQTPQGIEVVATTEASLSEISHEGGPEGMPAPRAAAPKAPAAARAAVPRSAFAQTLAAAAQAPVEEDTAQLAMSTLSFQDYVRERMLQRRHEAQQKTKAAPAPQRSKIEFIPPDPLAAPVVRKSSAASAAAAEANPAPTGDATTAGLYQELSAMKELIEERFNTLAWLGQSRQSPIQSNLTLKMIRAGYSPALARAVVEKLPEGKRATDALRWVFEVLERNLKTDEGGPALQDEGGVFALVGSTGVGKTTTTAKIAAQCARTYGAASVGLITLDSYRIGAHEQLRTYGRMLGVVAHIAHDQAALQDLLNLLSNRKLVLIDTTGVAPRDPRKREMLEMLNLPQVKRLLVLNAAAHADTHDEAVMSFRGEGPANTVITKIDEAVKLGSTLDAALRHQLLLRGICGGQRVPEDWERADASALVRLSMRSHGKTVHDPQMSELGLYFAQPGSQTAAVRDVLHA